MNRLSPKSDILRALFARSGNRCAYPGCTAPLINEKNQFIAQVCHIEAAEKGGERFNPNKTHEERRQYENLFILCYPHHIETNDTEKYTVQILKEMKAVHEKNFYKKPFKIDESLLYKISFEMEQYWSRLETLHKKQHIVPELAIEVDAKANFFQLIERARSLTNNVLYCRNILVDSDNALYKDVVLFIKELGISVETLEKYPPQIFYARNWEILNLSLTNITTMLQVVLMQMEIKYLEEFLKLDSADSSAKLRLENLKIEFLNLAQSASYVD